MDDLNTVSKLQQFYGESSWVGYLAQNSSQQGGHNGKKIEEHSSGD